MTMREKAGKNGWVFGALLLGLAWTLPVFADQPLAPILACRDMADATNRLACFDREAAALSLAPVAKPTVDNATTAPPPAPPPLATLDPQQQFGLPEGAVAAKEVAAGVRSPDAKKIQARIVGLSQGGFGITVFTFDNGQVWRQLLAADGDMLAKLGDVATLSRGFLSSYWLQLKSGRGCKVTRLR